LPLDPSLIRQAAAGIVPPVLVAACTLLVARRGRELPRWSLALAIGLGTAAGFVGTHGWPGDPRAADVKTSLCWGALGLAAAGALLDALAARRAGWLAMALRAALGFALAWYVLDFMRSFQWKEAAWIWCSALGAGALLTALALQPLARERGARSPAGLTLGWTLASGLAAAALLAGRSASLAQLAGALASALAGLALVQSRHRAGWPGGGAVSVFVLLHQGFLWAGHFAAELPATSAVLAGVAPLGGWLGELRALPLASRRWLSWLGIGLLGGAALWLAVAVPAVDAHARLERPEAFSRPGLGRLSADREGPSRSWREPSFLLPSQPGCAIITTSRRPSTVLTALQRELVHEALRLIPDPMRSESVSAGSGPGKVGRGLVRVPAPPGGIDRDVFVNC
jgi:hypothetical protein